MKTVHVFEVKLPNDGWEPLYEEEIRRCWMTETIFSEVAAVLLMLIFLTMKRG